MNLFLGCDVSKAKLDMSLVDERGVEQWHDQMPNEPVAIATFLLTVTGAYSDDKVVGVAEATGILHLPFADACYDLGVTCFVYNPLKTNQQIRASIWGKKTDRTDATMIARVGLMGEARPYVPDQYKAVKYYVRGQEKLSGLSASLKRYEAHLSDVLEDELTTAAKEMITGIQTAVKDTKAQFVTDTLAVAPKELVDQLRSIPGIGPYVAACLIGEIQDMQRFGSAKALIAYAGLDPKIRQSGHSLNVTGRLSKRGSPHLRRALFIAANVARQHDPNFRSTYDKKRNEGKKYTVATCVVARQLLKTVRAVWLRETPYAVVFDGNTTKKS
jgi:transposase